MLNKKKEEIMVTKKKRGGCNNDGGGGICGKKHPDCKDGGCKLAKYHDGPHICEKCDVPF